MNKISSVIAGLVAGLLSVALAGNTPKPQPYAIFEPALSCGHAFQLAQRVVERLGYTVIAPPPPADAEDSTKKVIRGSREGVLGPEPVTVTITCRPDGVQVDAEADTPPCEQANQIVRRTLEHLGYTVTSYSPAGYGKKGVIEGKRENEQEQDTATLTITCEPEAIYVDAHAESPVVLTTNFTAAITDFRRGFYSLFKPLAAEAQQKSPQ